MQIDGQGPTGEGVSVLARWFLVWIAANIAAVVVLVLTGKSGLASVDIPVWATALDVLAMWTVMVQAAARLIPFEEATFLSGPRRWFRPRDFAVGVPLGVASQLILMNVVNWPLSHLFPDTFNFDAISKRADDLSGTAPGAWKIVLVLVVVVGAPLVEEFVYRGCLQSGLSRAWGDSMAWIVTAAIFATVHLSGVEWPGLFAFALVLGSARRRTGTIGLSIITHMAYNATGLVLVVLT